MSTRPPTVAVLLRACVVAFMGIPYRMWSPFASSEVRLEITIYSMVLGLLVVFVCHNSPTKHVVMGSMIAGSSFLGFWVDPRALQHFSLILVFYAPLVFGLFWVVSAWRVKPEPDERGNTSESTSTA